MTDFEQELRAGFLEEATQLLLEAEQCFLTLEANPHDSPTIEKIFRIAHNIKGSSKAVGFDGLGAFTHEFESFLLKCKNGVVPITPATISLMLACNDHINRLVEALKTDGDAQIDGSELIVQMTNFRADAADAIVAPSAPARKATPAEAPIAIDPFAAEDAPFDQVPSASAFAEEEVAVDIFAEPADDALTFAAPAENSVEAAIAAAFEAQAQSQAEIHSEAPAKLELVAAPVAAAVAAPAAAKHAPVVAEESIRVSLNRLDRLLNFVGEMVILQTVLREQAAANNPELLRRTVQQMGKVTKEVQDLSMSLRMVPLKQTFQKMQRIVRDTSAHLGKDVQLILEGEETEVDKTVLESLSDPLVHMVRNAVDHGIESGDQRAAKGKPRMGTVWLRAFHQSGKLAIEVRDNGAGISAEILRAKATQKGILKPGQVISDKEAVHLVFHPGFSTKAEVTEVSGRGVGMDVVKTNIESLQGDIEIDTKLGEGSIFKVILPLTLAIIDGMVIRCKGERFVIPRSHVHESVQVKQSDLRYATGTGLVLLLRGENLPAVQLTNVLSKGAGHLAMQSREPTEKIAIIVRSQGKPFAALVDDIVGQHQVVIKKLGSELQNMRGFSGSAILGDGRPALILELGDLLNASGEKRQVV